MRHLSLLVFLSTLPLVPAAAQAPAPAARPFGVMHDLVGTWEGPAWFRQPDGTRHEVHQTERVEPGAGGTVLAIRGLGVEKMSDGSERTIHDAFAVVFRDRDGRPMMRAFTSQGQWIDATLELEPGQLTWRMNPAPNVSVRYVISVDADGRWIERGYQKYGDRPEQEFVGMTLTKQ
jgi:hypothetical protein